MKSCPQCGKSYPDAESFCDTDGSRLVASESASPPSAGGQTEGSGKTDTGIECPVCGGKAEPGEVICNFCGARLSHAGEAAGSGAPSRPEDFVPSQQRFTARQSSEGTAYPVHGRRWMATGGFIAAAIIAIVAGAWLALHLSSTQRKPAVAEASPAASPSPALVAEPVARLADTIPVQISGELASSPARNSTAARKVFNDSAKALLDSYHQSLKSEPGLDDGMSVRVRVKPDGSVSSVAIRASTASNPELDAEVAKTLGDAKFAPAPHGEADIDYPIIFARDASSATKVESELSAKMASLGPNKAAEYSWSVAPAPAAVPSPVAAASTTIKTPVPEAKASPAERPRTRVARPRAPRPPKLALYERVQSALHRNRRFRRVEAYADGSTITLFGKTFDQNDKMAAERLARRVDGVSRVINTIVTDTSVWADQERAISQRLQNAGLNKVTVKVIGSDAYLDGEVANAADKERAVTITQAAAPVKVRTNLIRVEPGRVFGF